MGPAFDVSGTLVPWELDHVLVGALIFGRRVRGSDRLLP